MDRLGTCSLESKQAVAKAGRFPAIPNILHVDYSNTTGELKTTKSNRTGPGPIGRLLSVCICLAYVSIGRPAGNLTVIFFLH